MALMDREVVTLSDDVDDALYIAEVDVGVDTLGVEVESKIDEVDVAGAFSVAKQASLNTIGAT
jgi:hypothetical protein